MVVWNAPQESAITRRLQPRTGRHLARYVWKVKKKKRQLKCPFGLQKIAEFLFQYSNRVRMSHKNLFLAQVRHSWRVSIAGHQHHAAISVSVRFPPGTSINYSLYFAFPWISRLSWFHSHLQPHRYACTSYIKLPSVPLIRLGGLDSQPKRLCVINYQSSASYIGNSELTLSLPCQSPTAKNCQITGHYSFLALQRPTFCYFRFERHASLSIN